MAGRGFGDFSGNAGEIDMLMRNSETGAFEVYDIRNSAITSSAGMGQVGLEWTIAGFGDFSGNADETDMLMRNSQTGKFEIYDIRNNGVAATIPMGQVGLEWSISGIAEGSAAGSQGTQLSNLAIEPASAPPSNSITQLTQTMAAFAAGDGAFAATFSLDPTPASTPSAGVSPLVAPAGQIQQG